MQAKTFNALEIQRMATRLANLLKRAFLKYGDQGAGMGIFPIVGRGDGSLNDSYRLAEPSDDIKDYHNQLNSLQPKHGPFFVHTRPNMYERRGMLIPHITGHPRSGSHLAMYERGQLINLITELILRTAFALNHKPGLILPTVSDKAQVVRPNSAEGLLLTKLQQANTREMAKDSLISCLNTLGQMKYDLQFAVVVSDLLSEGWETPLLNVSHRLEVIVLQIVDPSDVQLPNFGTHNFEQGRQTVRIATRNAKARETFHRKAQEQQSRIDSVLKRANAQHHRITTTEPLFDQMMELFKLSNISKRVA